MAAVTRLDFTDRASFPSFTDLPTTEEPAQGGGRRWTILGQVKENMTIVRPTLILTDRDGQDFAVTFADERFSLAGFKKGYTAALTGLRRTPGDVEAGKKGFVRVAEDESVPVIPGSLETVLRIGGRVGEEDERGKCELCGMEGGRKCAGCGVVRYCSKTCQAEGWTKGHKADCKIFKAIRDVASSHWA